MRPRSIYEVGVSFYRKRINMARLFLRIALLCGIAVSVWSQRDEDFCKVPRTSCGAIPPPLPNNFIMMREKAVPLTRTLEFESIYFDNINQKAKYVSVSSGTERHHIFDYEAEQVLSYYSLHPGVDPKKDAESDTCTTKPIDNSELKHVFGFKESSEMDAPPRMFNSYEMLRFGGEYQFASNKTNVFETRGFPANKFDGCVYDKFSDVTAYITYYFSTNTMTPAGSTSGFNIENSLFMSVPLAARYTGIKHFPNTDPNVTIRPYTFDAITNIPWFVGEPEFDYDTFKIPQWMYCKGHRGLKELKKLPDQFSTRIEESTFSQDQFGKMIAAEMVSYEQIYYDRPNQLARRDYTPSKESDQEIFENFQNYGRIKEIFDYNTGVAYIIHLSTGRCYPRNIKDTDYFETRTENMFDIMKTAEELFLIESEKQVYKGKYFARDIETDVWSGKEYDIRMNETVYKETYISTNGWHADADEKYEYSIPVRQTMITDDITDEGPIQTVTEKNFFKFKTGAPPTNVFNTDGCMETLNHTFIFIMLDVAPKDEIFINDNKWYFHQAAQRLLALESQIGTPLRVQKVQLLKSKDQYFLSFAFMEKAFPTERGVSVDDAIAHLNDVLNDNDGFSITFTVPGTEETKRVTGSDMIVLPKDWKKLSVSYSLNQMFPQKQVNVYLHAEPKEKAEVKKGMSPGGLAGLSIAMLIIGIIFGIAVMYFYIRRYGI